MYLGLEKRAGAVLRKSSTINIAPVTENAYGQQVLPKENIVRVDAETLTYTTDTAASEASPAFSSWWAATVKGLNINSLVRFERADFSGALWDAVSKYYESLLTAFNENGISWLSNDFSALIHKDNIGYEGSKYVQKYGYKTFNVELLELLQKFQ